MSRGLWFVAGAGAGVYAAVRARRVAEVFTADGLRDRVGATVVGMRMFRDEVAKGKAEAETELRDRLGLVLHEHRRHQELVGGNESGAEPAGATRGVSTGSTGSTPENQEGSG